MSVNNDHMSKIIDTKPVTEKEMKAGICSVSCTEVNAYVHTQGEKALLSCFSFNLL